MSTVEYLTFDDLIELTVLLMGEPAPIRDPGLLSSAAARPSTVLYGADAYLDVWTKAAALLQSIVGNHPLIDGNKRLGWLATAVFLEINGIDATRATNDDVYDLVISVAAGQREVEDIATDLATTVG